MKRLLMISKIIILKLSPTLTILYQLSLQTKPLFLLNIQNPISCHAYSYNIWENHHISPIICLQCTLKIKPSYKFENVRFFLDQHYIHHFFVRPVSIPLNNHHQVFNRENNQIWKFTSSKKYCFIHQQYQYQMSN